MEAEGGVGVDPGRGDGGVVPVRGGGVPLPDAGVLRRHDRHAHLLCMDQRLRAPQPVLHFFLQSYSFVSDYCFIPYIWVVVQCNSALQQVFLAHAKQG